MEHLRFVWRGGRLAFYTTACWLAVHATALAQMAPKEPKSSGGSYVLPYALAILGVALGLLFVCRPSRRRDRAKPEQYDQSKALIKD